MNVLTEKVVVCYTGGLEEQRGKVGEWKVGEINIRANGDGELGKEVNIVCFIFHILPASHFLVTLEI